MPNSIITFSGVVLGLAATGFAQADPVDADIEWAQLDALRRESPELAGSEDRAAQYRAQEFRLLALREKGRGFYERYPDDARRWEWLLETLLAPPCYWRNPELGAALTAQGRFHDAEVDEQQREQWETKIRRRFRPEFFASSQVTDGQRARWRFLEMHAKSQAMMRLLKNRADLGIEDTGSFLHYLLAYANEPEAPAGWVERGFGNLRTFSAKAKISVAEERLLARAVASSGNFGLKTLGEGWLRVLDLYNQPLDLSVPVGDGKVLHTADLRGKVVLVDFWSTGCADCVAAIPHLKKMHERYYARGFEIASICLGSGTNRADLDKILGRMDPPWLTAWIENAKPLTARFAITSVPVYFLLDQDGRLVGTNFNGEQGLVILDKEIGRLLSYKKVIKR